MFHALTAWAAFCWRARLPCERGVAAKVGCRAGTGPGSEITTGVRQHDLVGRVLDGFSLRKAAGWPGTRLIECGERQPGIRWRFVLTGRMDAPCSPTPGLLHDRKCSLVSVRNAIRRRLRVKVSSDRIEFGDGYGRG